MGGSSPAKESNKIAQASLNESKRQYEEQKAKEAAQKAAAMSNAAGSRQSANMTYSNNFSGSTNMTGGNQGNYSLLTTTAAGTESVIGTLMNNLQQQSTTLGG